MGASKIQNEQEVLKWFEEGRTYDWMIQTYRDKYNIETSISMWGNFRRRHGLDRRTAWDTDLIPWAINAEHRYSYPILMLRKEARRRAGFELSDQQSHEIDAWLAGMEADGTVLHYEPDTEQGWFYVPRRPGIDKDLIRKPDRVTTRKARLRSA